MRLFFERAIANITKHGDTDIFPFPIENHIFYDRKAEVVDLLLDINNNFIDRLAQFPPSNHTALAPVGYQGFRPGAQLDPLWNAFFLGVVLSLADDIERARIPKTDNVIFSYRYAWDDTNSDLFDRAYNWRSFMEHSLALAKKHKYAVSADISEFYPRLNHHRLDNVLDQLRVKGDQPAKIMKFLGNYTGTDSFGMPVGGPAARILSEILLNQIDRLLRAEGILFCRFADDYHLFADSYEGAFSSLLFLSEKLLSNQGLQLQKSKTRVMSGPEFISTSPLGFGDEEEPATGDAAPDIKEQSQNLMRFAIRFDPYSPTAGSDYELLRRELEKYDIIGLLKSELAKSRIHISLSKKIVSVMRFIDPAQRDDAVLSMILNHDLLYPIYGNVLLVAKQLYDDLSSTTKPDVIKHVRELIRSDSHVLQVELNLAYAIRLISEEVAPENEEALNRIYKSTRSIMIRRDIILTMAKWRAFYWLSSLRADFRTLSPPERRAFLIASYSMSDEGKHWRGHISPELSPFEQLVRKWTSDKAQLAGWSVPL